MRSVGQEKESKRINLSERGFGLYNSIRARLSYLDCQNNAITVDREKKYIPAKLSLSIFPQSYCTKSGFFSAQC